MEVLGRYPNGYHQIASVMQTISLADTLTMKKASDFTLECDQPSLSGATNLVLQAAHMFKAATGCPDGARLRLAKGIPEAAGLGGGSSDAAATLRGLNRLSGVGIPRVKLAEMAAALGSDVPFFVYGGAGLAEGRGEIITPLPSPPGVWLALLHPPILLTDKTRKLYEALTPEHYSRGERSQTLAQALKAGEPVKDDLLYNVFEEVAFNVFPGLEGYRQRLLQAGAAGVHLAGSGPTLFAIFTSWVDAEGVM
ncbi:MAG: 4-(cytidine 5'-diphospho)-2-C-methyl-D-erythritol kinase, partial [Dehalococcoidia bacterium]|nr:4-(cytidine 5'-diphospho)-2-C-methyl-D-erythritol kinase [Dehalococcoidia bacterium]